MVLVSISLDSECRVFTDTLDHQGRKKQVKVGRGEGTQALKGTFLYKKGTLQHCKIKLYNCHNYVPHGAFIYCMRFYFILRSKLVLKLKHKP